METKRGREQNADEMFPNVVGYRIGASSMKMAPVFRQLSARAELQTSSDWQLQTHGPCANDVT